MVDFLVLIATHPEKGASLFVLAPRWAVGSDVTLVCKVSSSHVRFDYMAINIGVYDLDYTPFWEDDRSFYPKVRFERDPPIC